MTTRRLATSLCLGLGLLAGLSACVAWPDPPAPEVTVTRLVTVPPMDMSRDVRTSDTIRVVMEGYETWEGQLRELWQEADACYKLRLKTVN